MIADALFVGQAVTIAKGFKSYSGDIVRIHNDGKFDIVLWSGDLITASPSQVLAAF